MTGPRTLLPTDLDLYDLAYLAGGPARVADTAVVALLAHGLLRVDPAGRLQAVAPAAGHPVDAAVLDAVGPRPRCSASTLRWRLAEDPRLTEVGRRLTAAGLLRRNPLAGLRAGWPRLVRTGAGRRALEQEHADRGGAGDARQVALHGPPAMGDRVLRDSVFGTVPRGPSVRGRSGQGRRSRHAGDGGSSGAYVGWGAGGHDGGGWGGGGWGGDGGCGGGDGGGGGC